jgi:hypothetical protein
VYATDGSQAIRHFNNDWSLIVGHALCIGPHFESPSVDARFVRSTLPDSVLTRYAGLLMRHLEVRAALDNLDDHFSAGSQEPRCQEPQSGGVSGLVCSGNNPQMMQMSDASSQTCYRRCMRITALLGEH